MRADATEGCAIVLVGDDALARAAVRGQLAPEPLLSVLDEGAPDELDALLEHEPDVVVWDSGPARHTSLPPPALELPTLLLLEDSAEATRAFRDGASVVRRAAAGEVLAAAVVAVQRGLRVLDGAFQDGRGEDRSASTLVEPLTPRELEVLTLLADGLSNRRIAKRLDISEHTVKFHVNALLLKLDADTRTAAVVKAARLGLLHL